VSLTKLPDGRAALSVADSGIGLPNNFAERQGASLGFRIINGLVRQIHGEIEVKPRSPGVEFQVTFPADRP
jgi:two-component sensor histidine kinase